MALNKVALEVDIIRILESLKGKTSEPDKAILDFAKQLSEAIDRYVRSGTVITKGSATTQIGNIT